MTRRAIMIPEATLSGLLPSRSNRSWLGPQYRKYRQAHGWSVEYVANMCGMCPKTVSKFERGLSTRAHTGTMEKLQKFWGQVISQEYLGAGS